MTQTVNPRSVYGPLVAASDVEDALLGVLKPWLPSYLFEVERQHGLEVGSLPAPRSWVISGQVERFPEDQLPSVIIASPGITEAPKADGRGLYRARWVVEVATQVAAAPNRRALLLARLYTAAARAACLQNQDEVGQLRRVDWMAERYTVLDSIDDRTVCVGTVVLRVEAYDVTNRNTGPLGPEATPGPESPLWPTVQTHDEQVIQWPLEEELP